MSERPCFREAAVIEATRTRIWSDDLRAHLSECTECSDTARVAAWIGDAATRLGRDQPAPDPAYIWLRGEVERRANKESAVSPFRPGLIVSLGLAVGAACAAVLLLVLPAIAAVVSLVRDATAAVLAQTSFFQTAALGAAWLASPLLLAAVLFVLFRSLR
jgi:hypothetical protein